MTPDLIKKVEGLDGHRAVGKRIRDLKAAMAAWQQDQPMRCKTNIVGAAGECLACDAEQGVACAGGSDAR